MLLIACLFFHHAITYAQPVTLRGTNGNQSVSVEITRQQASVMKQRVSSLTRANVPHYLSLWQKSPRNKTSTFPTKQGVLLVSLVTSKNIHKWVQKVGKHTIGFVSDGDPALYDGTGHLRIGDMFFKYDRLHDGDGYEVHKISSYAPYVESTFDVTPAEIAAFKAFAFARNYGAILDSKGNPHKPEWKNPGKSNWQSEGCAGAATSMFNPRWQKAFKESIEHIREVGLKENIPEMIHATFEMADMIAAFAKRHGLKQDTTPKSLVRNFSFASSQITIFNYADAPADPINGLQWRSGSERGRYGDKGWNGLGKTPSIPDRAPGQSPSNAYMNVRVNALDVLRSAL